MHYLFQAQNLARGNPMMKEGEFLAYLEEDNQTLHTNFLKGLEGSGKLIDIQILFLVCIISSWVVRIYQKLIPPHSLPIS